VLSVFILGAGIGGYMLFGKPPQVPQNEGAADFRPLVATVDVAEHNLPVVIEMDGNANAFRVITIGAQVKGQIKQRLPNARSGLEVKKGDVLFEIDPTNYELEIERLDAQLDQTDEEIHSVEVDILNAKALIVLSEQDWELQKKQLERVKNAKARRSAADADVDAATRQELTARNALQTLRNSQRSLEQMLKQKHASKRLVQAQLKQAHVQLEWCHVRAPVDGVIVNDDAEEGDFVREGDELVKLSDSSRIEVRCNLESDELFWLLQNLRQAWETAESPDDLPMNPLATPIPCEVVYEFAGSEVVWDGALSKFEGTGVDRGTRTFPVRVVVPEPAKYRLSDSQGGRMLIAPVLSSGMYVTIRVPIEATDELLRLPVEAVRPGGHVWVVRDGVLQIRSVSVAQAGNDKVLVRASGGDITAGDQVVVSPLVAARDGMNVRVEAE